ncbi:GNAT family N-acetyltransferase [Thaumasiovibrio subtropicus]|uniref:GNAT family N-acetyltransferase n=1 Tax=Thaumasiovibrio subtropicus TaxID=1891207 RepID=UPI000B36496A|nr:GNAT family N-acetyltransferase [Thaumasiovibrio subtropicus]
MDNIIIRHVKASDAEQLQQLYANTNTQAQTLQLPYPSLDKWEKRASEIPDGMASLIADCDGKVIGQLGLMMSSRFRRRHVAELGMGVDDAYQGRGVGSKLLGEAINLAENWMGATRIELTVYTDNQAAIALYKKFGFKIEGESPDFALRDGELVAAYHMARLKRHQTKCE